MTRLVCYLARPAAPRHAGAPTLLRFSSTRGTAAAATSAAGARQSARLHRRLLLRPQHCRQHASPPHHAPSGSCCCRAALFTWWPWWGCASWRASAVVQQHATRGTGGSSGQGWADMGLNPNLGTLLLLLLRALLLVLPSFVQPASVDGSCNCNSQEPMTVNHASHGCCVRDGSRCGGACIPGLCAAAAAAPAAVSAVCCSAPTWLRRNLGSICSR
jgi:hypothetical protein